MKTTPLLVLLSTLAVGAFTGCQTSSSSSASEESRVTVNFENPENFSDFKDSLVASDVGRRNLEAMLRRAVQEDASRYLRDGQTFSITFTDVDLAGDYLPSAGSGHDVRVIKQVYPPRMRFRYELRDANGAVLKQGEQQLQDLAFQYTTSIVDRHEELFYDRNLLRDWLRKELKS